MRDPATDELMFVCDDARCPLAAGPIGETAAEIRARVAATAVEPDDDAEDDEEPEDEEAPDELDSEDDETAEDEPPDDPSGIDPTGEGAPCPVCSAARPPRGGKLLAVATSGLLANTVTATPFSLGMLLWMLVQQTSPATGRLLAAQKHVHAEDADAKPGTFVVGQQALTVVVLQDLPFDGHLLRYGNQDALVPGTVVVPGKGKKKSYKKSAWVRGEAKYGPKQAPPGPAARADPIYVRELQEDLIWLGYLSTSRGSPSPGKFDVYTLGAVLGFKQDLLEVYGVAASPKAIDVKPGSVHVGEFTTAIWSQPAFISPLRILLDWRAALRGKNKQGLRARVAAIATGVARLKQAKKPAAFKQQLIKLEATRAALATAVANWPRLAALERVTEPFLPFAPKAASVPFEQFAAAPTDRAPRHANAAALKGDPVWSSEEYNARSANRSDFFPDLDAMFTDLDATLAALDKLPAELAAITAPPDAAAGWTTLRDALTPTLAAVKKLVGLVRYWVLDSPAQLEAWLTHITDLGTVDQPTAVYLKALRRGAKIGPGKRPAYQMKSLTLADDFATPDLGATYLRQMCLDRDANTSGKKATTMPEIVALQFYCNESGMRFTHTLGKFDTQQDSEERIALMGIDTNAHRKGSFDAVYHAGGDWYWSRGWGVGQATEANRTLDGVELRRGLPVMPPGADAVRHPPSFIGAKASVEDAIRRKILAKYNNTARRDCTFGETLTGNHYDCRSCLKRFHDEGLMGAGKYGSGGVFVPIGKDSVGVVAQATGFMVDIERLTPFARGEGQKEDPDTAQKRFKAFFGAEPPAVSEDVAAVLELMNGKRSISAGAAAVAKAKPGVDKAALAGEVAAHVAARAQLPCSWLLVRIRYAGTGEQAFASLITMLRVIGDLDTKNEVLKKHIQEASRLRGGE